MRCANLRFVWAALLLVLVGGCGGGGNSSVTTCSGGALASALCSGGGGPPVALAVPPTGPNTTEVIVDSGGFFPAAVNVPYVTVTICPPNSGAVITNACVTVDHVFLDTGSYGLRLLKSSVASLSLPAVTLPPVSDPKFSTPAGTAVECYPFVLGGIWGPLATADVHIGGETAASIPIQVIDDPSSATPEQRADCIAAAGGQPTLDACIAQGGTLATCTSRGSKAIEFLFSDAKSLQANGILGVGMMPYDCGASCLSPDNYTNFFVQYYVCPDPVAAQQCQPGAVDFAQQVQNPVVHFGQIEIGVQPDDNGTIITLPVPSPIGAVKATGSLVFGIGTRRNNQIEVTAKTIMAGAPWIKTVNDGSATTSSLVANCADSVTATTTTTCTFNPGYLYFTTTMMGSSPYLDSYIDSGSNAYFFTDSSIQNCTNPTGAATLGGWYCPPGTTAVARSATLSDWFGSPPVTVKFSIANSDLLFGTSGTAFDNLGGSMGNSAPRAPQTFVWGLPFFYGRSVYTSISGQLLSPNGPWNAFYDLPPPQ